MTQTQLNTVGFIVSDLQIQSLSYRDYLTEYGKDETTTPRGVADRMHIREVEVSDCDCQDTNEDGYILHEDDCKGEHIEYQIWSWGVGGNHPYYTGTSFDNEEDAELYYYDLCEWYISEKNWDAPRFHDTEEEAMQDMADGCDKPIDVIRRYLSLKAITQRKEAEHRAQVTAEHDKRKAWLAIEVPKEAASIIIDEEFKSAIKWAESATGNEKSNRIASAMKGLLSRNGKEKIDTDFWQVVRILKAKV